MKYGKDLLLTVYKWTEVSWIIDGKYSSLITSKYADVPENTELTIISCLSFLYPLKLFYPLGQGFFWGTDIKNDFIKSCVTNQEILTSGLGCIEFISNLIKGSVFLWDYVFVQHAREMMPEYMSIYLLEFHVLANDWFGELHW